MFMAQDVDRRRDHRMPALAHHREQDLFRLGHMAFQPILQGQQRFGQAKRGRFTVAMPGFHPLRQRDQPVGFAAVGVMVAGQDRVGQRTAVAAAEAEALLAEGLGGAGQVRGDVADRGFRGKIDQGAVPSVGSRARAPRGRSEADRPRARRSGRRSFTCRLAARVSRVSSRPLAMAVRLRRERGRRSSPRPGRTERRWRHPGRSPDAAGGPAAAARRGRLARPPAPACVRPWATAQARPLPRQLPAPAPRQVRMHSSS